MKFCKFLNEIYLRFLQIKYPEPIIERKSMGAIFQKKGKKKKRIKNIWNIFGKRSGDCLQLSHAVNC